MEVIYLKCTDIPQNLNDHAMAIGFFDGVHLGHQQLFDQAKEVAKYRGIESSALTFSPHPDEVIKGDKNRKYITPLKEKIQKIESCGIDKLFVMNFDKDFASLSPADFIQNYIVDMNTKHVVVGFDFTFGFKAKGNTKLLKSESLKGDFNLSIVPQMTYAQSKIGSTETKQLIYDGNVEDVPYYLGTPYKVQAQINQSSYGRYVYDIETNKQSILPRIGNYDVNVLINNEFYRGQLWIEPHYEKELFIYGYENYNNQELEISFINRVEEEVSVSSFSSLSSSLLA